MSNVILSNTSAQVNETLCQSYKRLTGSYIGPYSTCSDPNCGVLIKKGDNTAGLCISNSSFDFYVNYLKFTNVASDSVFEFTESNNFIIKNSNSCYLFNSNGNLSISNCLNSSFISNGLQVSNFRPALTLIDNCTCSCQEINFYNCSLQSEFSIKNLQTSYVTAANEGSTKAIEIRYNCALNINNGSTDLFNASGNYITIGCDKKINTGYNFYVNNSAFFKDNFTLNCGFYSLNTSCISGTGSNLNIDGCLVLKRNLILGESGTISLNTNCISSLCSFYAQTGCLSQVNVSNDLISQNGYFSGINVSGSSRFSGDISFLSSVSLSTANLNNLYANQYSGLNFNLSGSTILNGNFNVSPTGNTTHVLNGQCMIICNSGSGINLLINSYPSFSSGFYSSGRINYSGFDSFSTGRSNICGCLGVSGSIISPCVNFTECLTGTSVYINNRIFASCASFGEFCQSNSSYISCFTSTGLVVGFNCAGYIDARNTSKAWGIFQISNSTITSLAGYNISTVAYNITCCLFNISYIKPINSSFSKSVNIFSQSVPSTFCGFNFQYAGISTPLVLKVSPVNCVSYSPILTTYSPINTAYSSCIYATTFAIEAMIYNYNTAPTIACIARSSISQLHGYFVSFIVF